MTSVFIAVTDVRDLAYMRLLLKSKSAELVLVGERAGRVER
jgi:hypothetical protein